MMRDESRLEVLVSGLFLIYLLLEGGIDSEMKLVAWIVAALMGLGGLLHIWLRVREVRSAKAFKMTTAPEMKVEGVESDEYPLRDLGQIMKNSGIEIRIRSKENGFNVTFLENGKMRKMVAAGSGATVSEAMLQAEASFMEKEDV